ncbi:hypothetical protein CONLIGDRAFT_699247 [Coniochaeta ligniaria NRRL 30616]|uniref:DUF6546 domain-containing protein n=1 Tax=Coniochaeta ligniaria NRRL 30616 TaxID=1408157 RepID=A0A1J7IZ92_9PEZI|nr:hypothetical protein CONLIGDRAFT_699247 [Coniochaeta ligniaria NRRL 30616]
MSSWDTLPRELQLQIWGHLIESHNNKDKRRTGLATYASVSRSWQSFFETHTFCNLLLTPKDLADFRLIVNPCRTQFVKHILLLLEISDQHTAVQADLRSSYAVITCKDRQNDQSFTCVIHLLLRMLSKWETRGPTANTGLTLELGAYSAFEHQLDKHAPRESASLYGKYLEGSSSSTEIAKADPFPGQLNQCYRDLARPPRLHARPALQLQPMRKLLGSKPLNLCLAYTPDIYPSVAVVTGFLVRLRYTRNFHPRALSRIISCFPNIAAVRIEHWRSGDRKVDSEWDKSELLTLIGFPPIRPRPLLTYYPMQDAWHLCSPANDQRTDAWHLRTPPSIRILSLYQENSTVFHLHHNGWQHASPSPAFARALVGKRRTLEHLSVAFHVQAEEFFGLMDHPRLDTDHYLDTNHYLDTDLYIDTDYWADKNYYADKEERRTTSWPALRSLALTSLALVSRDYDPMDELLMVAADAAGRMPALDRMELWLGMRGHGGVFRYTWANARDGTGPRVEWIGTWDYCVSKEVVERWQGVADARAWRGYKLGRERAGVRDGDDLDVTGFLEMYGCKIGVSKEVIRGKKIKGPGDVIELLELKGLVVHEISAWQVTAGGMK